MLIIEIVLGWTPAITLRPDDDLSHALVASICNASEGASTPLRPRCSPALSPHRLTWPPIGPPLLRHASSTSPVPRFSRRLVQLLGPTTPITAPTAIMTTVQAAANLPTELSATISIDDIQVQLDVSGVTWDPLMDYSIDLVPWYEYRADESISGIRNSRRLVAKIQILM